MLNHVPNVGIPQTLIFDDNETCHNKTIKQEKILICFELVKFLTNKTEYSDHNGWIIADHVCTNDILIHNKFDLFILRAITVKEVCSMFYIRIVFFIT